MRHDSQQPTANIPSLRQTNAYIANILASARAKIADWQTSETEPYAPGIASNINAATVAINQLDRQHSPFSFAQKFQLRLCIERLRLDEVGRAVRTTYYNGVQTSHSGVYYLIKREIINVSASPNIARKRKYLPKLEILRDKLNESIIRLTEHENTQGSKTLEDLMKASREIQELYFQCFIQQRKFTLLQDYINGTADAVKSEAELEKEFAILTFIEQLSQMVDLPDDNELIAKRAWASTGFFAAGAAGGALLGTAIYLLVQVITSSSETTIEQLFAGIPDNIPLFLGLVLTLGLVGGGSALAAVLAPENGYIESIGNTKDMRQCLLWLQEESAATLPTTAPEATTTVVAPATPTTTTTSATTSEIPAAPQENQPAMPVLPLPTLRQTNAFLSESIMGMRGLIKDWQEVYGHQVGAITILEAFVWYVGKNKTTPMFFDHERSWGYNYLESHIYHLRLGFHGVPQQHTNRFKCTGDIGPDWPQTLVVSITENADPMRRQRYEPELRALAAAWDNLALQDDEKGDSTHTLSLLPKESQERAFKAMIIAAKFRMIQSYIDGQTNLTYQEISIDISTEENLQQELVFLDFLQLLPTMLHPDKYAATQRKRVLLGIGFFAVGAVGGVLVAGAIYLHMQRFAFWDLLNQVLEQPKLTIFEDQLLAAIQRNIPEFTVMLLALGIFGGAAALAAVWGPENGYIESIGRTEKLRHGLLHLDAEIERKQAVYYQNNPIAAESATKQKKKNNTPPTLEETNIYLAAALDKAKQLITDNTAPGRLQTHQPGPWTSLAAMCVSIFSLDTKNRLFYFNYKFRNTITTQLKCILAENGQIMPKFPESIAISITNAENAAKLDKYNKKLQALHEQLARIKPSIDNLEQARKRTISDLPQEPKETQELYFQYLLNARRFELIQDYINGVKGAPATEQELEQTLSTLDCIERLARMPDLTGHTLTLALRAMAGIGFFTAGLTGGAFLGTITYTLVQALNTGGSEILVDQIMAAIPDNMPLFLGLILTLGIIGGSTALAYAIIPENSIIASVRNTEEMRQCLMRIQESASGGKFIRTEQSKAADTRTPTDLLSKLGVAGAWLHGFANPAGLKDAIELPDDPDALKARVHGPAAFASIFAPMQVLRDALRSASAHTLLYHALGTIDAVQVDAAMREIQTAMEHPARTVWIENDLRTGISRIPDLLQRTRNLLLSGRANKELELIELLSSLKRARGSESLYKDAEINAIVAVFTQQVAILERQAWENLRKINEDHEYKWMVDEYNLTVYSYDAFVTAGCITQSIVALVQGSALYAAVYGLGVFCSTYLQGITCQLIHAGLASVAGLWLSSGRGWTGFATSIAFGVSIFALQEYGLTAIADSLRDTFALEISPLGTHLLGGAITILASFALSLVARGISVYAEDRVNDLSYQKNCCFRTEYPLLRFLFPDPTPSEVIRV